MGYVTTIRLSDKTKVQIEKLKETLTTRQSVIETAIDYYYHNRSIEGIRDSLYTIIGMAAVSGLLLGRGKEIIRCLNEGKYEVCASMANEWVDTFRGALEMERAYNLTANVLYRLGQLVKQNRA